MGIPIGSKLGKRAAHVKITPGLDTPTILNAMLLYRQDHYKMGGF
jgi:hypothetical protein